MYNDMCLFAQLQHCDAFVANIHFEMSEKARGTFISALSFNSEQASLTMTEDALWEVTMDKKVVRSRGSILTIKFYTMEWNM